MQVPAVVSPDRIFGDYAYMSSYSDSWLRHVSAYATTMAERLGPGPGSRVVEVGSNDGHLLACFGRPVRRAVRLVLQHALAGDLRPVQELEHQTARERLGHNARVGARPDFEFDEPPLLFAESLISRGVLGWAGGAVRRVR